MIKIPRSQSTTIKNMIYPEVQKTNKNFHKNNIQALKKRQDEMRQIKEDKENNIPAQPYKMKEFKNVESKLAKILIGENKTITNNYNCDRNESKVLVTAPIKSNKNLVKTKSTGLLNRTGNNNIKNLNKNINNKIPELKVSLKNDNNSDEENIYAMGNLEKGIKENFNNLKNIIVEEENKNPKIYKKGPTPKATDINILPPKVHKDFISDNKLKIIQHDVPNKVAEKKEAEVAIHKNFGKTPEYLRKYKQDAEDKKEVERRIAEESKYPKGTKLLSEDERVETLNNLLETRKEIMTILEKMPISMRTMSIQNRKTELENKLSEIENAVKTFSRKQVFIKTDS